MHAHMDTHKDAHTVQGEAVIYGGEFLGESEL